MAAEILAKGAALGRKWTIIEGQVYDITDYITKHPGGQLIEGAVGIDGTALFHNHHPFSEKARLVLQQFLVKDAVVPKADVYPRSAFYDELVKRVKESGEPEKRARDTLLYGLEATFVIALNLICLWGHIQGNWICSALYPWTGIWFAMGVMHEACHGGTTSKLLNAVCRVFACCFGAAGTQLWIFSHLRHHAITNDDNDPDCDQHVTLRYRSQLPWKPYHQYQQYYAWFLYMLTGFTFHFGNLLPTPKVYKDMVPIPAATTSDKWLNRLYSLVFFTTFFYLPWHVTGSLAPVYVYWIAQAPACLFLSCVFQVNHLTAKLEDRSLKHEWGGGIGTTNRVKQDWAIDQVRLSNDFSLASRFITHFTGGLNYQIEHHLFPTLNHWAYPRVGKILRTLCAEKGVPYCAYPSTFSAVADHYELLRRRGLQSKSE